ncbi:MAG: hypothetical protein FJ291_13135 [Planctomycetes bacterium]|nr:hypothetical protein [Planctomycetota bacterium]
MAGDAAVFWSATAGTFAAGIVALVVALLTSILTTCLTARAQRRQFFTEQRRHDYQGFLYNVQLLMLEQKWDAKLEADAFSRAELLVLKADLSCLQEFRNTLQAFRIAPNDTERARLRSAVNKLYPEIVDALRKEIPG